MDRLKREDDTSGASVGHFGVQQWTPAPSDDPSEIQRSEEVGREAAALASSVEQALESGRGDRLSLHQLIYLRNWSTLNTPVDAPKRAVADRLLILARDAFQRHYGPRSRLALFPIGAVFLPAPGARLQLVWLAQAIRFDALDARVLIERIEEISDVAHEWWPDEPLESSPAMDSGDLEETSESRRAEYALDRRFRRSRSRPPADDRASHLNRAYEIATTGFDAVALENSKVPPTDGREAARGTERYRRTLAQAHERIDRAERLLDAAGQRTAKARYGRGMLYGTVLAALVALALAVALQLMGEDPEYALPLLAGALGAVVSVLQRMTSPTFRMDLEGGHLVAFGAVRPFVGGVFGIMMLALLEAKLLNVTPVGASPAALHAALAFFAGFNERFAQDALTSSITPLPTRGTATVV